jgi:hypothetical protein
MLWGVVLLVDVVGREAGPRTAIAAGALFGVAATMRTEALVYAAVAVGVTTVAMWLRDRALAPVARVGVAATVGLAAPLLANNLVERLVLGTAFRATRAKGAALTPGGGGGSRLDDSLTTTVGLNHFRPELDWSFGAAIALMVIVGVVFLVGGDHHRRRLAIIPLIAAGFLYLLRFGDDLGFVPGLLTASPLAAAGVAVLARRPAFKIPAVVALLALPLVWFFQYSGGANPQWGGRYVLLTGAVLATIAVTATAGAPRSGRVALFTLACAVTACGAAWLSVRSHAVADAMTTIADGRGPVVSSEYHLLREGGAFYAPERPWLTAPYDRDVPRAAQVVREAGFESFTLVGGDRGAPTLGGFERTGSRTLEFLPGFEVVLTRYQQA